MQLLAGLAFASALTGILLALGERIRVLLRLPCRPSLRPAVAWLLGSFSLGTGVLLLGLAGAWRPWPLVGWLVVAGVLGRWSRLPALSRQLGPFLLGALPLLPVALAPPFFYDAWVYHLGLPWQALQDGALTGHPGNLFSTFPPLAQLIYAIPLSAGALRAPAVVHLMGFCVAAAAAAGLARGLGAHRVPASLAGIALLYLPTAPIAAGFPAAEAWTVAGIVTALALALFGRSSALAGWTSGIACAARLQGLPWVALCGAVCALRARKIPSALGRFTAAAAVGALPWWLKNGLLLGCFPSKVEKATTIRWRCWTWTPASGEH